MVPGIIGVMTIVRMTMTVICVVGIMSAKTVPADCKYLFRSVFSKNKEKQTLKRRLIRSYLSVGSFLLSKWVARENMKTASRELVKKKNTLKKLLMDYEFS